MRLDEVIGYLADRRRAASLSQTVVARRMGTQQSAWTPSGPPLDELDDVSWEGPMPRHANGLTRSLRWRVGTRRNKRWRGGSRYGRWTRAQLDHIRGESRRKLAAILQYVD